MIRLPPIIGVWRGHLVISRPGISIQSSWPSEGARAYWRARGVPGWAWPRAFTRPRLTHCSYFWAISWLWVSVYLQYRHHTLNEYWAVWKMVNDPDPEDEDV